MTNLQHELLKEQLNSTKLRQDYTEVNQDLTSERLISRKYGLRIDEFQKKVLNMTDNEESLLEKISELEKVNCALVEKNQANNVVSPRSYPIQEMRELEDALEELNTEKNAYLELKHKWEETLGQLEDEKTQREILESRETNGDNWKLLYEETLLVLKNEERGASDLGERFELLKKYSNELEIRCEGLSLPQSPRTEKNGGTPARLPGARRDLTDNQKTVDFNPRLGSDKIQGLEAEVAFLRTELETSRKAQDSQSLAHLQQSHSLAANSETDISSYKYQLSTIALQNSTQSRMYETNLRVLSDQNHTLQSELTSLTATLSVSTNSHQLLSSDYNALLLLKKTLETNLKEEQIQKSQIENY